ncbi:MAG: acyl-CoA dehydrogenase family protein [Pseudomonadota bacterium]
MDFSLTAEQTRLVSETRRFAETQLGANLVDRDAAGALDADDWQADWQACARQGLLGLAVPTDYGGQGLDVMSTVLALEAVGYGCPDNGLTLGLNGQIWAVQEPLLAFGSEAQKKAFLPGLCDGRLIGAHGMTEPQSGSNAFALQTRAVRQDDGYVLTGSKTYVGMAPACDLAIVFATTNPDHKHWGLTAFIVEASREGFRRAAHQHKMGTRTVPMGTLELDACWVPTPNRLGPEGAGASIFQHAMEWERSFIFASHVGRMARQLDECLAYAGEREVFGQTIDGFQSVSNRLADMRLRLETAQLLLYKAAWLKARGDHAALEAALAKLHLSEAFMASSLDAIRIHGGRGYVSEAGVERDLRDSVGGVIYSGTSDIQRQLILKLMKK